VKPTSGVVPGELTGWVPNGRRGGGRAIAVAVNGTIIAMGRTFSMKGRRVENFEVMVPQRTFLPGPNEVRVFEVMTRAGRLALRPL